MVDLDYRLVKLLVAAPEVLEAGAPAQAPAYEILKNAYQG